MYFFQGESGEIRSPNYPNHYGNEREVQWVIEAPVGTRLQLKVSVYIDNCINLGFRSKMTELSGCID